MPITPTSPLPITIQPRLRISLTGLGGLQTKIPANLPPKRPKRGYARFIIQTRGAANLQTVSGAVHQALGGSRNGPSVSFGNGRFVLPMTGNATLADTFNVRPLFTGADPRDRLFMLADFVVLTLGISPLKLKASLGGGSRALFDFAYELRVAGRFLRVDPEIPNKKWGVNTNVTVVANPTDPTTPIGPVLFSSFSNPFDQAPADHAWNLRSVNLGFPNNGGAGITVGQVDSGTRVHPESDGIYLPVNRHFSVIDGSNDATDPLSGAQPAHGLATASVLASRGSISPASASGTGTTGPPGNNQVTGVATSVSILPVRAVSTVVAISNIDVAEGIWHCVGQNVDVITISVGGYLNMWLERVVSFAVFKDIIVVAAAGQYWPLVPAPACYPDCIAATATDALSKHWSVASSGPQIDIAAPGAGVYCADVKDGNNVVNPSSGTSFSAPTVAGAAALWLATHGRQSLLANYQGQRKLAEVFRRVLRTTARVPSGWNTTDHGPGILDIGRLLAAPLPAAAAVPGRDWTQYDDTSEFDLLMQFLGNPNQNYLKTVLAQWFNTTVNEVKDRLEQFGAEILGIINDVPTVIEDLKQGVQQAAANAQQAVSDTVDDIVDAVVEVVSDTVATVMGWFP